MSSRIIQYFVADGYIDETQDHGKFVLTEKGFLIEGIGLSSKANVLIFKAFFKGFSEKSDDCFYPLCSMS